jgi:tyrosine-specific transport protein
VNAFAFFSIVTSFIGIGLGLVGFVRDLFHLNSNYRILFAISLSLILSTLFFTFLIPNAFLTALDMTGGYGDTWLSGLIPIGMCWVGRHIFKIEEGAKQITRKWILAALALFALIVMYMQTYKLLYL